MSVHVPSLPNRSEALSGKLSVTSCLVLGEKAVTAKSWVNPKNNKELSNDDWSVDYAAIDVGLRINASGKIYTDYPPDYLCSVNKLVGAY